MSERKNYIILRTTVDNVIVAEGGILASDDQTAIVQIAKLMTSKIGQPGYNMADRISVSVDQRDVFTNVAISDLDRQHATRTAADFE